MPRGWGRCRVMRTFSSAGSPPGLDTLAAAATSAQADYAVPPAISPGQSTFLSSPDPYNPVASLLPKTVKNIFNLEFVEMSELRADMWVEEPLVAEGSHTPRRAPVKPPVTDVKLWLECYARMAAILVARFPEKGPELWAYQTSILRATHNYKGANWVAYYRQFRRDMLARKDLNWSTTNARPYNEVCRNFNDNRCRFARCRYLHICSECFAPLPALTCPRRTVPLASGLPGRSRQAKPPVTQAPRVGGLHGRRHRQ